MVTPLQPIEYLIADSKKPDFKFPKVDILNEFTTYFTANSHEFAVENKLKYLLSQLNIYENHLYKYKEAAERKATELAIDSIRKLIEKHMVKYTYSDEKGSNAEESFKYYPDIRDPNFNTALSKKNELQIIVEKKYPIVKTLLSDISVEKGCHFSRMSGSGSVCYGLFDSEAMQKKHFINSSPSILNFGFQ